MTDTVDQSAGALVLVIEDEDTQRLLTLDCLTEAGFRVEEAADGENAVSRIRALQPDLVLLDVMLPGIDGFEVCRQIRADEEICHTPVVLITGRDNTNDVKRGFSVGATDFFAKPVQWNLLPTRIEFVLRTNRLERELRISMEAAEKANAAKSTLLSTMGHELRTPLNAVIGFTEMMKQQVYGPVGAPQYEDFIEDIHASGSQLLKGINDLLEIVNSESLELDPKSPHVSFSDIVEQVVAAAEKEAAATGIRIVTKLPSGAPNIRGDADRLRQAVSNLVSNGIKFSKPDGTLKVSLETSSTSEATLSITDEGIGIDPKDLLRIMEPFEQADNSLSRKFEGMGLGLPLSRAIIHLHGGELSLVNAPERGTVATITLPIIHRVDEDEAEMKTEPVPKRA